MGWKEELQLTDLMHKHQLENMESMIDITGKVHKGKTLACLLRKNCLDSSRDLTCDLQDDIYT